MKNVKLKYKNRYIDNIVPGTKLFEISKIVQDEYKYPIVGAKLGEFNVGLNTEIKANNKVEFYDLSTTTGNRIYARSLEFLVTVAAKKVIDETSDILINYSLDNGIFCEITGQRITKITVQKIEEVMREMVQRQIPYQEMYVDRFEAINYFKKHHQMDKVENLRFTTNRTITLHSLDGVYDNFFGPLVYNTGVIDKFNIIYLKENSFIITYPGQNDPDHIKEYVHHKQTFDTYKAYQEWGRLIGISTVSDLNKLGTESVYDSAVDLFEAHYEDQLFEVSKKIKKEEDRIKIILIAGPSSSGKTTTANKLSLYLKVQGITSYRISLDDYFVDRSKMPKDENGNYDFASIKAIDTKLFNDNLNKLLKGEKIRIPHYDFVSGENTITDKTLQIKENDVIIVEGIHTLNDELTKSIPRENKFKIFISPLMHLKLDNHNRVHTTDVRKIRRIVRDNRTRGTKAEDTLKMWPNVDKEARENIYPYQDDADEVINSSLGYELNVLRTYAEPLLYGIESSSKAYPEAIRLINLLRNFLPITSEIVPKDSVLREFIGGGIEWKEWFKW